MRTGQEERNISLRLGHIKLAQNYVKTFFLSVQFKIFLETKRRRRRTIFTFHFPIFRTILSTEQHSEWGCEGIVFLNKRFQIEVCSLYPRRNLISSSPPIHRQSRTTRHSILSSILLVTTLFCFTIFTTPKTVLNVVAGFQINSERELLSRVGWRAVSGVCNVLFIVNYSCNFYFYCSANKEIKTATLALLSQWRVALTSFSRRKLNSLNVLIW